MARKYEDKSLARSPELSVKKIPPSATGREQWWVTTIGQGELIMKLRPRNRDTMSNETSEARQLGDPS